LHKQYPHLKNGFGSNSNVESHTGLMYDNELLATSSDYLEKIFQIPFSLKSLTQTSKANLITEQLKIQEPESRVTGQKEDSSNSTGKDKKANDATATDQIKSSNSSEASKISAISNPITLDVDVEKLLISIEEERFMKGLAFLIGDSPRTIKRFINIFRILRTHVGFRLQNGDELSYYFAAMIILAVITGRPLLVDEFFAMIRLSDDNKLFLEAISEKSILVDQNTYSLYELLHIPLEIETQYQMTERIRDLKMNFFKDNVELVSRFSFSSLQYYATVA